jgi:mono/diheme cytochrome c family protein
MLLAALAAALAACGRQAMDVQPKYSAYEASARFAHTQSALPRVPGTLPRGSGDDAPPARTLELLERGRERFGVYCAPCHGEYGDGDGRVVAKFGFPPPPSLHDERLRAAPDSHLVDVVTNGYGVMYAYATALPPRDRWAVVGYVRALQLARHADVARFPELRAELAEHPP